MPIKELNPQILQTLKPAVLAKLNETLGAEFGLSFKFGGGNYSASNAVLKLEISILSPDGKVVDKSRSDYERMAHNFNCEPEWLDKTFRDGSKTFKVVGLMPNRPKNCVSIEEVRTGKRMICSPEYVRTFLGGKQKNPGFVPLSLAADPKNHAEIVRRIEEMQSENPEMYYADGEYQAAGMTAKQIYNHHYTTISKQIRSGK